MREPYAYPVQGDYTCSECDVILSVGGWMEAGIFNPDYEECPECDAPIDVDVLTGNVTPIR